MSRTFLLRSLLPLGLLFGSAAPVLAGSPVAHAQPTVAQDGFEAIMGDELVVDGTHFDKAAIQRAVVTGRAGATAIETLKLRLLIAQEVARRVAEGADAAQFLVSSKEIQGAVKEQADYLSEQYPDGAYTVENMMDGGLKAFKSQLELTRLFNRVYLPPVDPADFPPVTLAALKESEIGTAVLDQLKTQWETDKLRVTQSAKNPLLQSILFKEVFDYLQRTSEILKGDAIPADVLLRINGDDITVAAVWNEIKDSASADDVLMAKKWLTNMHLLRKGLSDVWLSDEDAEARFEEHAAPFDASMIPMKNFALGVKRFPSMDMYKGYRHALESFKQRIKGEMTPEALQQFAELRTRKLVGGSTVDVDVILISAYDFKNRQWKENGWKNAETRVRDVVSQLQEKRDWDDVLDEYSEFYDAPTSSKDAQAANTLKYKGRFRNVGRNDLMQKLGEDEFQAFINGGTLADFIFFKLDPGSVGGVKKGPYGWYIPLLRKRNERPISNDQSQLITMAEQDYVNVKLGLYLNELYTAAKIEGLSR